MWSAERAAGSVAGIVCGDVDFALMLVLLRTR